MLCMSGVSLRLFKGSLCAGVSMGRVSLTRVIFLGVSVSFGVRTNGRASLCEEGSDLSLDAWVVDHQGGRRRLNFDLLLHWRIKDGCRFVVGGWSE